MYIRCTICAFRFPLTKPRYSGVAGRKLGTEAPPPVNLASVMLNPHCALIPAS